MNKILLYLIVFSIAVSVNGYGQSLAADDAMGSNVQSSDVNQSTYFLNNIKYGLGYHGFNSPNYFGLLDDYNLEEKLSEYAIRNIKLKPLGGSLEMPFFNDYNSQFKLSTSVNSGLSYYSNHFGVNNGNYDWVKHRYSKTKYAIGCRLEYYPWKKVGVFIEYTGFKTNGRLNSFLLIGTNVKL